MALDILEYLEKQAYPWESIQNAQYFFKESLLPLPKAGEFFQTEDYGALILIDSVGCSIRFTSNFYQNYEHPRLIQPLLSRDFGKLRVDINPGLYTPFTNADYTDWFDIHKEIEAELHESGLEIRDFNGNNAGRLPAPFDDYHVILDPGAIKKRKGVKAFKKTLPLEGSPQDILFGELKQLFNDAWPKDQASPDLHKFALAWEHCRDKCNEGLLVANWKAIDYRGTKETATRYNNRLNHSVLSVA